MFTQQFFKIIGVTILSTLINACTPQSYVTLLKNPDGSTGKVIVTSEKGQTELSQDHAAATLDSSSTEVFEVSEQKLNEDFSEAFSAQPLSPSHFRLYFIQGGTQLTQESEALIPEIIKVIASRPGVDISIIGHTDSAGPANMNTQLGLKRAKEVSQLLEQAALEMNKITITSHGEKNQLIKTPDETPEPLNRRVEVTIR